jgi:hypothetical protein
MDGAQHDLKDTLELWFKMYATGGTPLIQDTSWWMTRMQDRYGRLSKEDTLQKCDELTCFAIATIGTLIDKGVLRFSKEATIPDILVGAPGDPGNDPITQALLERMEAMFEGEEDE